MVAPLMRCRIDTHPAGGSRYEVSCEMWMLR